MQKRLLNLLAILLLVGAIGCAEEPTVETETAVDTGAADTTMEEEVPRLPDGSEPTQVVLSSYAIEMPSTLPEGTTLFTVSNEATDHEHNFEIEGQGIEKMFEQPLQPGEVKTMEVTLTPGEYRVYCPVGDHASQGMETTLTVTASDGAAATGTDDAAAADVEGEMGFPETPPAN